MFTGIVESMAKVCAIQKEGTNLRFTLECNFTSELKIDQSLAHNGVCLTVVNINEDKYDVVAIHETLIRTNLGVLKVGDKVKVDEHLFDLETDKITLEVTALSAGTITAISAKEGEIVKAGQVVGTIDETATGGVSESKPTTPSSMPTNQGMPAAS